MKHGDLSFRSNWCLYLLVFPAMFILACFIPAFFLVYAIAAWDVWRENRECRCSHCNCK